MEDEKEKQDAILQSELEKAIFNANIYKEKYEETEVLLQETRREKDELNSNLQRIADRVPILEERICELETLNTNTTSALQKLKDTVISHIRYGGQQHIDHEKEDKLAEDELVQLTSAITLENEQTPGQSSEVASSKSRGKQQCGPQSKSPAKTSEIEDIDIDEIEMFFKKCYSKNAATEEDMKNLKDELKQKRERNEDLEATLQGIQDAIARLNINATTNTKVTHSIKEQSLNENETNELQIEINKQKTEENKDLGQDSEEQMGTLKYDPQSANTKLVQQVALHEEDVEEKKLEAENIQEKIKEYQGREEKYKDDKEPVKRGVSLTYRSATDEEVRSKHTTVEVESNVENASNETKEEQPKYEDEAAKRKCVATKKMSQPEVRHNAPAGGTYLSIQDAGRSTLEKYCDNYPNTTSSFILPNIFLTSFPDVVDNPQVTLTDKQKRQFDGFVGNLKGEREEYDVYLAFTSLARKCPSKPILVIWSMKFDSDNSRAIKRNALKQELPSIQLGPGEMSQEKDFVIFVGGCGVVFGEVKKSATKENIERAEEQLSEADHLLKKVMYAIAGPAGPLLPTSKLILIPGESGASPADKTSSGYHLIYYDMMQSFQAKWNKVVSELEETNVNSPINPSDFEKLVQIITGIWSMKPFQKKSFKFNNDQASFASNIQFVDKSISDAILCSEKGAKFSPNVPSSLITPVPHRDDELNVLYFSPQQKLIFDNYKHALIRANAGCGKTLLILIKILAILEKDPTQKILLVAVKPHHLRCKKILERNNVTVEILPCFPTSPSCNVVICELQDFFQVPRNTLLSYDLSLLNLFFDDVHGYRVPRKGDYSNFTDIGDFVDYAYAVSKVNGKLCWFGIDIAQHFYFRKDEEKKVTGLFRSTSGSERNFNIPVVVMDQILRNSEEIVGVLENARKRQANSCHLDTSKMISNLQCGHHITSQKVVYHKLKEFRYNYEFRNKFLCARVEELFSILSSNSTSFDFSTVAILFDVEDRLSRYRSALEQMLITTFNLDVQTIERHIISNNNNNNNTHVVLDVVANAQSFESAVLVYVRCGDDESVYNILSRGRTVCMIVDVLRHPLPLQNIDVVEWKESNGVFTQINSNDFDYLTDCTNV